MRILLGGVPLGCDNIGDEAIVGCVVDLLRRLVRGAEITVCTRDGEGTAARLGVAVAPLYGFGDSPDLRGFAELVRRHDVYIWFGATGLSDYPEIALRLLRASVMRSASSASTASIPPTCRRAPISAGCW